jgi:hypothetical protein
MNEEQVRIRKVEVRSIVRYHPSISSEKLRKRVKKLSISESSNLAEIQTRYLP